MNPNMIYILLHVLSAVVWVGGMFFAYMCLRPVAATQLEVPARLQLWVGVFGRFFPYVWAAVVLLPLSGYLMIFSLWQGMANAPLYVHIMNGLGMVMILIYLHVFFAPYKKLKNAVTTEQWPVGGKALGQIRMLVGLNTAIGLSLIAIAAAGRYIA